MGVVGGGVAGWVGVGGGHLAPVAPPLFPPRPQRLLGPLRKGGEIFDNFPARKYLAEAASDLCCEGGGGAKSGATSPAARAESFKWLTKRHQGAVID